MCLFTHLWGDWLVDCAREKKNDVYSSSTLGLAHWTPIHKRSISIQQLLQPCSNGRPARISYFVPRDSVRLCRLYKKRTVLLVLAACCSGMWWNFHRRKNMKKKWKKTQHKLYERLSTSLVQSFTFSNLLRCLSACSQTCLDLHASAPLLFEWWFFGNFHRFRCFAVQTNVRRIIIVVHILYFTYTLSQPTVFYVCVCVRG